MIKALIPPVLKSIRLDLLNIDLVKSMLMIFGIAEDSRANALLTVLDVLRQSNTEAKTLGDLVGDLDLEYLISIPEKFKKHSELIPDVEAVVDHKNICPHCGQYLSEVIS